MTTVACVAAYGSGGLGQFLEQIVEDARSRGELRRYFSRVTPEGDPTGRSVPSGGFEVLRRFTPLRFSHSWASHVGNVLFDRAVSHALEPDDIFIGFNGCALRSMSCAARIFDRVELVSATLHVDHVRRRQTEAIRDHPWDGGWLNETQHRRTIAEYAAADRILVPSRLALETFVDAGVPSSRLAVFPFRVHPRFTPRKAAPPWDGVFRIVAIGNVTVAKGAPVLLEAFTRFQHPAELTFVGGTGSRGMRRFMERAIARDPRIRVAPGDPLPHLVRSHVCVHASYFDGLGLAPLEALACGVPVIVTEDTGMKEFVREGETGWIVPTGRPGPIFERLEQLWLSASRGG